MAMHSRDSAENRIHYSVEYASGAKEESPIIARWSAVKSIKAHVRQLEKDKVDLSKCVYLGIGAGPGLTEGKSYRGVLSKFGAVIISDIAQRAPLLENGKSRPFGFVSNVYNVELDAQKLHPIPNDSVHLLTCLFAQDFFSDRKRSTQEMKRVLRPDGKAIVFLHHPKNYELFLNTLEKRNLLSKIGNPEMLDLYRTMLRDKWFFPDIESIRRHFESNGLKVDKVEEKSYTLRKKPDFQDWWYEVHLSKKPPGRLKRLLQHFARPARRQSV
jgi:ubiquinone/menaquinone biosynthesis C-methylase UbiE